MDNIGKYDHRSDNQHYGSNDDGCRFHGSRNAPKFQVRCSESVRSLFQISSLIPDFEPHSLILPNRHQVQAFGSRTLMVR